ncbi:MAG: glycosyltransferase family 39 protein, partial [bacterium]|nr:glycosyltransferase family 39 protein [bacterium]
MSLIAATKASYKNNPLIWILGSGIIARLLAVFFSGGYIASDDHFLVVHYAWRWLRDDTIWMFDPNRGGHSLLYPGVHMLLFKVLHAIGVVNTEVQMTINRFLHAIWSIPIIWLGYRFVERATTERRFAELTGWLLALLWIVPAFSVYQLGEMVSAVPLFIAILKAERNRETDSTKEWLIAGLWLGFAVSLRYQIGFAAVGMFIALLIRGRWRGALLLTVGALLGTIPLGILDWVMLGTPYANPIQYFTYNSSGEMYKYVNRPWYNYILLILGVFIPPFSFLLFGGMFKAYKKLPVLFGGTLAFLIVHSIIPNKQERFIATILPTLVVVGVTGIAIWLKAERFRLSERFLRISLIIFWCLNLPVMVGTVVNYNRRAEIKSLAALQADVQLQ